MPGEGCASHGDDRRAIPAIRVWILALVNFWWARKQLSSCENRFDGVLGLGLESLALDPEFSFYGQLTRSGPAPSSPPVFLVSQGIATPCPEWLLCTGVNSSLPDPQPLRAKK